MAKRVIALCALLLCAGAAGFYLARRPIAGWLAQRCFERGAFHEALRWKPAHAQARAALGKLELQRGRLEHAFLELQAATELQPDVAAAWIDLARVRIAAGQPDEAELLLGRAIELEPLGADARKMRAQVRLQLGRYRSALTDDPAARRPREPPSARPLPHGRGDRADRWPGKLGAVMRDLMAKVQRADWSGAEAVATSARETYPGTSLGPWIAGVIETSRKRLDLAETHLLAALAVSPRSHRAVTNLVPVWSRQKGPLYTGDRLVQLIKADPGFFYPVPIAARAYLEGDQPARAEATARLPFAAAPSSPAPYRALAALYLEIDRASDALATCDQGLERFPDDPELQLQKARGHLLLGNRQGAIASLEKLVSRHRDDQVAAADLATLLVEARADAASRDRALQIVRDLEDDAPVDPPVLGAMGRVYLKLAGDARRAQDLLETAVDGAPDDPGLRFHLAVAQSRSGKPDLAGEQLRIALGFGRPFSEEAEARRLLRELAPPERRP